MMEKKLTSVLGANSYQKIFGASGNTTGNAMANTAATNAASTLPTADLQNIIPPLSPLTPTKTASVPSQQLLEQVD